MTTEKVLELKGVEKSYGSNRVLAGVDFALNRGELVCVVGPSGSGKTTLLRCISALSEPTAGSVEFEGEIVNGPPEKLAVIFQDYSRSLLPWMTVYKNIELPIRKKFSAAERRERIEEILRNVGLEGKGDLYPWQMSGGMQQRAAIARGLAYQPDVLLMDEPFAAVDAQTRIDLEDLVLRVRDKYNMSILFVTHDIDEAVYLADRVIVLSGAPTTVSHNVVVDVPSPRDQITTKANPRFVELRTFVFEQIQAAKTRV
ncbi:ABC transporter ATP-binding protein [Leucobacter sp. W1038]|uniref:ABC transporter ATP-binding protein n=1 Tax=Leucobacter sp. W1038 TaxID=3438281 RepID=UPI003D966506